MSEHRDWPDYAVQEWIKMQHYNAIASKDLQRVTDEQRDMTERHESSCSVTTGSSSMYSLEFTPLAEQLAKRHHTLDEVRAEVCRDIDHNLANGLGHVDNLCFTTVCIGSFFDENIPNFIVKPKGNSVLLVDAAEYEALGEPLDAGPFAGFKVSIPVPDNR